MALQNPRIAPSSGLGKLERSLGVALGPEAVADRTLALPIQVDAGGGRQNIEGQPLFPATPKALMSVRDPVTADLSRAVNFGAPGRLAASPPTGATFTPLIETTPLAALVPAEFALGDPPPRAVIDVYMAANQAQVLAGRLSGELKSAFTQTPPTPKQDDPVLAALEADEIARVEPFVARSQTPAQILLVADADVFDDSFYINPNTNAPVADNGAFILNALDNLGGDEALMELRSRAPAARPMDRVDALRAEARQRLYKEQQRLEALLQDAEGRLEELEARRAGGAVRKPQELAEIANFRDQTASIRRQLRGVEREFRDDVDALAARLEFVNVWLPPIFAAAIGAGVFFWRSRRRPGAAA
jgi:ABC-type uncharacterized transport system involved in gliding motility auxiliary subunit